MPPGSRWTSARLLKLSLSEYSSMDVKHLEANLLACLRGMAVSQLAGQLCSKAHVWKGECLNMRECVTVPAPFSAPRVSWWTDRHCGRIGPVPL